MRSGRLLAYAIIGIVTGLLVENGSLRLKQKAAQKTRKLKRQLSEKLSRD